MGQLFPAFPRGGAPGFAFGQVPPPALPDLSCAPSLLLTPLFVLSIPTLVSFLTDGAAFFMSILFSERRPYVPRHNLPPLLFP